MTNRARLVQVSCAAVLLLLAVTPAVAKGGRTLWLCSEDGCVQVDRTAAGLVEVMPVIVPVIHRPAVIKPVAASAKRVPADQLIDMSLVTGVFQ
jgi:hypothetical protein